MRQPKSQNPAPQILAPAGNKDAFLAAVAARADAIYCGLKNFSARMEAKNFDLAEFAALVGLAHKKGISVFVAINSLLKSGDLAQAGRMLDLLQRMIKPDAVIIQDLALLPLVDQAGFSGEIHLSTLANVSFPRALDVIRQQLKVDRVVLPRELNIDELKTLAQVCPPGLDLEVFVHGALCYSVSGRCYWSSYLGGRSSLRGRCVQPCRRQYAQNSQTQRYFSCQDLSVDVLTKVLLSLPRVRTWKIEGRKKGPHYVYYTVCGYRILRDHGRDPEMKKKALQMLSRALGRVGTHYFFLPQRPQNPVDLRVHTGSGMLVGTIKGPKQKPYFEAREKLLPGDVLRLGYEGEAGHTIKRINRSLPKGGRMFIKPSAKKRLAKGAPVFLTDRRDQRLIGLLAELAGQLDRLPAASRWVSNFKPALPQTIPRKIRVLELPVYRSKPKPILRKPVGIWLSEKVVKTVSGKMSSQIRWWLPPVIWPEHEKNIHYQVQAAVKKGARHFILNAAWQKGFFKNHQGVNLWAGPFCNLANPLAIATLEAMGFSGAIVSPELGAEDFLELPQQSPIPLGIVIAGNWPLCVARSITPGIQLNRSFTSPRGEQAWASRYGPDYWVFPNWKLDLRDRKKVLQKAGYRLFVHMIEPVPQNVKLKKRQAIWNWEIKLQ